VAQNVPQITSDENKLQVVIATFEQIIVTAHNQKLVPGALSTDILNTIIQHIKDVTSKNNFHNFVHQPLDLYKLEVSFIHRQEKETVIIILHVPFIKADNLLLLYEFIPLPIHFNFSANILCHSRGCPCRPHGHRQHGLFPNTLFI
jgi:hypothetical protein